MKPWGVYIHVPYCSAICPYCDFNVYRLKKNTDWDGLKRAYLQEIKLRIKDEGLDLSNLVSIYFGGGTPSLAPVGLLKACIDALQPAQHVEITLEADPQTFTQERVDAWYSMGMRRLSTGWQSTHPEILKKLGRLHRAEQAWDALAMARAAGFTNINVDLIFAVPGQTEEHLAVDLERMVQAKPQHISIYALTYHTGTPFDRWRASGKLRQTPEETELAMMRQIQTALRASDFEHYEVSNYAQPGMRSQHNQMYWRGATVLGIGPGAHGLMNYGDHARRWENHRDVAHYISAWTKDAMFSVAWEEDLDAQKMLIERIACGVRQKDGFALSPHLDCQIAALCAQGLMFIEGGRVCPTDRGMEIADLLASTLCC